MEPIMKETEIPLSRLNNTIIPNITRWTIKIPEINLKSLQTSQNKYKYTYIPGCIREISNQLSQTLVHLHVWIKIQRMEHDLQQ